MARLRSYWSRLSWPGRVLFTGALLIGVTTMVVERAHGAREGGAPIVMLALLLVAVIALDTVGRGVVSAVRRLRS